MIPLKKFQLSLLMSALAFASLTMTSKIAQADEVEANTIRHVTIPNSDHFVPFALSINAGDSVKWTNNDTDDHTIVSDDAYTSPRFRGVNLLIHGTDSNAGKPGVVTLKFKHPGVFIYYCRFHSKLDDNNQPIAPGPKGGIQDGSGNYGTPMMGVIIVR